MKKLYVIFSFCFLALPFTSYSQDDSPVQFGADIMSRYVWRGLDLGGQSLNIQPYISYNCVSKDTAHSLKIGAWGAYSLAPASNGEVDLFITYTYKSLLSLTVTDYFFPGLNTGTKDEYFVYNQDSTGHVFEGMLTFNGTEKIPFTLLFAINLYGNDAIKINEDGTSGGIVMSKYIEAGYRTTLQGVDFNAFIGAALDNPDEDKGETGFYLNESAAIINLGVKAAKKIKISENYSLPLQCSLITNPELEKIYLVFGISL